MTILITAPNYDGTTAYLYHYTKEILKSPDIQDKKIICLERPRLTKKEFSSVIEKKNPKLVVINGHGSSNLICGDKIDDKEEVILKQGENHTLLKDRLVYARSCLAAASLGDESVRDGGCFIGYLLPFMFVINEEWVTNPLKDNTARTCLRPSNELICWLIKGNNANEAAEKSKSLFRKILSEFLKNKEKEPAALPMIKALWNNMSCQVVLGDGEMSYSG